MALMSTENNKSSDKQTSPNACTTRIFPNLNIAETNMHKIKEALF